MNWEYQAIVQGELCSKSNQRRVARFGQRTAIIKSESALEFVQRFLYTVPRPHTPFTEPVALTVLTYYKDRRRDLDVALLQDCIQKAGIIKNDRQVEEIHAFRYIDKENPRVVFRLTPRLEVDPRRIISELNLLKR